MQRRGPPPTKAQKQQKQIALGIGLTFAFLAFGAAAFLIYWFVFRKTTFSNIKFTSPTTTVRADQRILYRCVLGECVQQVVDKNDPDINHNLTNNVWFDNPLCQGQNWKEGDPPPCRGKFKCAPPPPSLSKTGASAKGNTLQGGLCTAVPDSQVATECGPSGELCSDSDTCQAKCIAQFFTCPTASTLGQTQCVRATGAALNSATIDVMLHENCPLLCTPCYKNLDSVCANGGSCVPETGTCSCPAEWAGQNCQAPRFGTCFAHDGACSNSCTPGDGNVINNCGENAFPAYTCRGSTSGSCTCISVEDVQKGSTGSSNNLTVGTCSTDGNGAVCKVKPQPGANFGCNGVQGTVCRLDGFNGADASNACVATGSSSLQCSGTQCSSNDDCKDVCVGGNDGVCTTTNGKSMCSCPSDVQMGTEWNICGSVPQPGTASPTDVSV